MPEDLAVHRPVRVGIVDDTRTIRAMIRMMLQASPRIEVVGEAGDPFEAREMIRALNPDVITLDVVMPRMSGLSFLERLMRLRPMPVVMVSSRTTENSQEAIAALSLGAVDCIDLGQLCRNGSAIDLAETVLMAATSNLGALRDRSAGGDGAQPPAAPFRWNGRVVLIGSSTGGVDALLKVLADYPQDGPPTVICQHMPKAFLESFARRLDKHCRARVELAAPGEVLAQGHILLAPGGDVQTVLAPGDPLRLEHLPHDGGERYVPSVNMLFGSAVPHAARMVGVMLTGMGRDGAQALLAMREAGAHTIVQDAASAVIDGMPRAARDIGAASEVAGLQTIGRRILAATSKTERDHDR